MKDILFLIKEFKSLQDKKAKDVAYSQILRFMVDKKYCQKAIYGFYKNRSSVKIYFNPKDKQVMQIYRESMWKALKVANIKSVASFNMFLNICFKNDMLAEVTKRARYQAHFIDGEAKRIALEQLAEEDINYLLFENKYDYDIVTSDLKPKNKELLDEYISGETFESIALINNTSKQNIHQTYGRIVNKLAEENWEK